MDWLYDSRTNCWSVLTTMPIKNYLEMVTTAHQERGSLGGQRDVLKTTTAKRIRERMISDITLGAVLPPVVIGIVVPDRMLKKFPLKKAEPSALMPKDAQLSIIDGMQRTEALIQASESDKTVLKGNIRVEFWLTRSVRAMIYRMLVLNTGQVPWTLSRQLTVVYAPLIEEIQENVPEVERVFSADRPGRRVGPAQYGGDALIELYLAFSLRKTGVDTKEALSEEFSRLDFVKNLSEVDFQDQFYTTLGILAALDKAFSRYESGETDRFSKGRNVFGGQPARIGFVVAVALLVLGRPGLDSIAEKRKPTITKIEVDAGKLIAKLKKLPVEELGIFLSLDVLAEVLDKRVGQVGRYERAVFFEAFKVLVDENFSVPNMEPCWRAH